MIDLAGALTSMAQLVLVAVIGFVATKAGRMDRAFVRKLTGLLLDVTLPCMIIASVSGGTSDGSIIAWAFVLSTVQFFLLLATGWLSNVLLRTPADQRPVYLFMSVATNTGFIGMAVITAFYGDFAALLASIFIMIQSVFVYSIGFAILIPGDEKGLAAIPWKKVANPAMIASLAALVLFFSGLQLPELVNGALTRVGSMTSTIAMLVVGQIVANSSLRGVLGEWRLYPNIVLRQLVVPALLFWGLRALGFDELLVGVFTIMFAMPVGSMVAPFCEQLGRDPELGGKGTVLSTLASFALIPLLVLAMMA